MLAKEIKMFKMKSCSESTFNTLLKFCKSDNGFSQETLYFCGVAVACMQPNMIGERDEPDFYWCRGFLKFIF